VGGGQQLPAEAHAQHRDVDRWVSDSRPRHHLEGVDVESVVDDGF
jgi:hypothetical protein